MRGGRFIYFADGLRYRYDRAAITRDDFREKRRRHDIYWSGDAIALSSATYCRERSTTLVFIALRQGYAPPFYITIRVFLLMLK